MPDTESFASLLTVPGVDQYIFVDRDGNIFSQAMAESQKMAELVSFCGLNAQAIGKINFRYLAFSLENQGYFFIFPVGKYYLGVIKQEDISCAVLVDNILQFLKDNVNRQ
jgi:hypothetical protein